jgi:hypothetical protein
MLTTLAYATLQLMSLGLVLGALEWCFPNRPAQRRLRPQLATDLAFYFGQHLLWLGVELSILLAVRAAIAPHADVAHRELRRAAVVAVRDRAGPRR